MNWIKGDYVVTDNTGEMDVSMIHGFLTGTYWARGIDQVTVERSMANSLCLGVFHNAKQVGFGRAITDRSTFAYLADVFILPEHRGRGLASWLVDCFLNHQELQGLRRWLLATADAHTLYGSKGFGLLHNPERFMEIPGRKT